MALMSIALRSPALRQLWLGQVGSSIGDELFKIAFIWLAVQVLGADTGYIASLQLAVGLVFALFFGKWGDHTRPDRTLIWVDLIRAGLTLMPVVFFLSGRPNYPVLVFATIGVSALGTYFEPALQSMLPVLAKDLRMLRSANGLMATTYRIARVVAPLLVSFFSGVFPLYHFFTLDAASFVFSAFSIRRLHGEFDPKVLEEVGTVPSRFHSEALKELRKHPDILLALILKSIGGSFWNLVYGIGLALLAHELGTGGVRAFGWIMASYGVGNLSSALVFGNFQRKHQEPWVYLGFAFIGLSFVLIALSHSLFWICFFSATCAIGGPMNDTPFLEMIQDRFKVRFITRMIRFRMIAESALTLLVTIFSPFLFKQFGVRPVILASGVGCVLISLMTIPTFKARSM